MDHLFTGLRRIAGIPDRGHQKLSLDFSPQALAFYTNLASLVLTLPLIARYHDFPIHNTKNG